MRNKSPGHEEQGAGLGNGLSKKRRSRPIFAVRLKSTFLVRSTRRYRKAEKHSPSAASHHSSACLPDTVDPRGPKGR